MTKAPKSKLPPLPQLEEPRSIPEAVAEINDLALTRQEAAYRIGNRLNWLKEEAVEYGNWGAWLKENIRRFGERTALRYMEYAARCENADGLVSRSDNLSDLSQSDEWDSPIEVINAARRVLGGFDLDPASTARGNQVVQAKRFFSKDPETGSTGVDGLKHPWEGRVWMNPPYCTSTREFVKKLHEEYQAGNVTGAIVLLNRYHLATSWSHQYLMDYPICISLFNLPFRAKGRKSSPIQGTILVCLGREYRDDFFNEFSINAAGIRLGPILEAQDRIPAELCVRTPSQEQIEEMRDDLPRPLYAPRRRPHAAPRSGRRRAG